jgi:hypothetical protein
MPRARAADNFVWRAAARPERARLLGAIAIALSCGGLGVVAGRWSAQVAPDPRTRTAALIEAVSKETQAKLAAPKPAVQGPAPAAPAPVAPPVTRAPAAAPEGGQARSAPAASARAPESPDPESPEAGAAEPPRPIVRPGNGTVGEAEAEATRALPTPGSRRSHHAPTGDKSPAAPNYQALRDYVLSR